MKLNNIFTIIGIFIFFAGTAVFLALFLTSEGGETEVRIDRIEDIKGLGYSGQRKAVTDKKGSIFVAYRKKFKGSSEIFVAKIKLVNGEWKISGIDRPISAIDADMDQRVPSIDIDSNDNMHVVWYGGDSEHIKNNRQIKYSRSVDGGISWSKWKNISVVDGFKDEEYWQEHPYILASSEKELFSVWEGKDEKNEKQQIKFSKSLDGGETWTHWQNVQETSGKTQSRPTMVEGRDGKLHLFAYSSIGNGGEKQQIIYSTSSDRGDSWDEWKIISDQSSDSRHVSVAIDSKGKINLAWRSLNGDGESKIMHASLQRGEWSEIKQVAISQNNQFFPSIANGKKDKGVIAWMESEKNSKLPNEDPSDGKIFLSSLMSENFSQPREISEGGVNLYPNMAEIYPENKSFLIYEKESASSDKYDIVLKFIK